VVPSGVERSRFGRAAQAPRLAAERHVRQAAKVLEPKNPRVREAIFWPLSILLAACIIALDREVLFVYLPRWFLALPIFLFMFPSRVNSTYWARAAVCVLLIALPFMLSPVRWNLLKSFYLDCLALDPGMEFSAALEKMNAYHQGAPSWGIGARVLGVEESATERDKRLVIIPSPDYDADWCMLYREDERLARVEISPD
jgi:hypothetical protein